MARSTIAVAEETGVKLRKIKKFTKLPIGTIANIGIAYLEPKIINGELIAVNGRLVPAQTEASTT